MIMPNICKADEASVHNLFISSDDAIKIGRVTIRDIKKTEFESLMEICRHFSSEPLTMTNLMEDSVSSTIQNISQRKVI